MWEKEGKRKARWSGKMKLFVFRFSSEDDRGPERYFAVSSLNELRAFIDCLAHHKGTQMPRDEKIVHAHLQTSLSKRDFSGYIMGARAHKELTFTNTFSYKHETTNNNNNHHGS